MRIGWPAYIDEWRGNQLREFKVHRVLGDEDGVSRIVDVCTSDDIVEQIKLATPTRCRNITVPDDRQSTFSHRLYFPQGPGPDARVLFNLLKEVLSVRVRQLDVALVLDWYQIPPDENNPEWRKTKPIGELRYRAKYYGRYTPRLMHQAREELAEHMGDLITRHPLYARADYLLAAPGHDRQTVSCSEDLTDLLSQATGVSAVRTDTTYSVREQAKGEDSVDLTGSFFFDQDLSEASVIVVDDCIKSGRTMTEMGRAARAAGAAQVLGLAPVRTMRGS